MKPPLFSLLLLFSLLSLCPSPNLDGADRPNVLLLCIDDLRPELGCYGVDYIVSPHIDALAARSRVFTRHYVQAPTCGASRYALLTGRYGPESNTALFAREKRLRSDPASVPPSMPAWFRKHGYTAVSVGKVSHHPGGLGGPDWDDPAEPEMPDSWDRHLLPAGPWQHPRGAMHGLANGEIRIDRGGMALFQAVAGPDTIYPDGLIAEEAIREIESLTAPGVDAPFFLAVGIIRPHLPFGAPEQYLEPYRDAELPPIPHPQKPEGKTTWHGSGEFMGYQRWWKDPNTDPDFATEVRRHYAACVTYADALVGRILGALASSKAAENTLIVLWGDHGWHLGEHAVWGKHTLFEESLHSPLLIHHPSLNSPGRSTAAIVETTDLFPTLAALAGLPAPDFVHGKSLVPLLEDPAATMEESSAFAYHRNALTLRTDTHRVIAHRDGSLELYDHSSPEGETRNIASENLGIAGALVEQLNERETLRNDK